MSVGSMTVLRALIFEFVKYFWWATLKITKQKAYGPSNLVETFCMQVYLLWSNTHPWKSLLSTIDTGKDCMYICNLVLSFVSWWSMHFVWPRKVKLTHVLSKNATTTKSYVHLGISLAIHYWKTPSKYYLFIDMGLPKAATHL